MKNKISKDREERRATIYNLYKSGKTLSELAQQFGVTKQRIGQIVGTGVYGGATLRSNNKKKEKYKKSIDRYGKNHFGINDLIRAQRTRFRRKRANSKLTGYEWDLNYDDIEYPTHCPILGIKLDYFAETRQENSPSFDRFDNSKGYVKGNVYIISWRANRIKNNGTAEEHLQIANFMSTLAL